MVETHVELAGSRRPIAPGARRVRDLDPHAHVEVTLVLQAPPLPATDKLPARALSAEEIVQRYGAPAEAIRKVEAVLRSYGLRIEAVGTSGRSLRVSGTAHAIETAFQANLGVYHSAELGEFRGRESAVNVPVEIAGLVHSVLGLDQRRMARRAAARPAASFSLAPMRPAELEEHYNFPPRNGAVSQIGIAEFGIPQSHSGTVVAPAYFPDDVKAFCTEQDRPTPQVSTVAVNLAPLTATQYRALPPAAAKSVLNETSEVMMDIEIVAALCPEAHISVYFAGWDQKGWVDLLEQIVADRPVVVSISYGLAEDSPLWAASALQAINEALQIAALAGITICCSAGDDGSGCAMEDTRLHVEFPASSPFVLAVGGTMLSGTADPSEEVWWEPPGQRLKSRGGATGGGVSALFPRPAWQTQQIASLNHGAGMGRIVPDVAALAGAPYYQLTLLGRPSPAGGTSAATPLWASLLARIDAALPAGKRQRFRAPLLYHAAHTGGTIGEAGCTDITRGHNASHPHPGKGYHAGTGFDAVTGWGVPNGKQLLATL